MATLQELFETFDFLDDWADRYGHLIELGAELEPLTDDEKNDESFVRGCQSQVWFVGEKRGDTLHFRAESNAHIVRGLIAVVLMMFQDKTPDEVLAVDHAAILQKLGLDRHLSPGRNNGLYSMINRIRGLATAAKSDKAG